MTSVDMCDHEPAKEIAPGVILFTAAPPIGNAIVVEEKAPHPMAAAFLASKGYKNWLVETDFGNRMTLCDGEIHEMFNIGPQSDYQQWAADRARLQQKEPD